MMSVVRRCAACVSAYRFLSGMLTGLVLLSAGYGLALVAGEVCQSWYPHLNPSVRCGDQHPSFMKSYEAFKTDLEQWIEERKKAGAIDEATVYFRDLENGPWFGIRESEQFLPASLFKVPVMIAVLKAIERKPSLADEQLGLSALPDLPMDTDDPEKTLRAGQYYSIDELLERMIVHSDNLSMELLERRLVSLGADGISVQELYSDLGLLPAEDAQTISVFSYSSLFRILYNARYLTRDSSEKAMSLLARSAFKDGIPAGVPEGVEVAHKFGVHNPDQPDSRLFHDCGIVYHPLRPYMLCVMTRGDDIGESVRFMAELSRRVYAQVEQNIRTEW
jgi:beta-lactamase class A